MSYNVNEAVDYFNILTNNFQNLHWKYREHHCDPRGIEDKNMMDDICGWGLQTIYNDPDFPYHGDIDPHDEGPEYFKDTPLVFGFFKRIKEQFVDPYRSFLMTFPPNHYIGKWLPGGIPHGKIFIPIVTNNQTTISDLTTRQEVLFELGKVYMFDMTSHYGEFKNKGDSSITFITFNVPAVTFNNILSTV
jgi:hypothetical protein